MLSKLVQVTAFLLLTFTFIPGTVSLVPGGKGVNKTKPVETNDVILTDPSTNKTSKNESKISSTFPAPKPGNGSHSQCFDWRKKLSASESKKGIVPKIKSSPFAGTGDKRGACGQPYLASQNVVCLWSGSQSKTPMAKDETAGWVTGASPSNCFQEIKVTYNKKTVTGVLAEACPFVSPPETIDLDSGCSGIFVSENMWKELGGKNETTLQFESWDFVKPESAW
ncbi:hypothetical protein CROQUDRAFT_63509 [Cronartium quercuum f. sp. fusiforme G11]|uniref:Secreted protein n=1 Tax=Cronartium quercuum f. sp. fusiforme G11 TaxID=708437 RepID=A0A9P6NLQ6_9BASI|nr:hypothetical protein CROQUDRAFT_63509 [Cronartium quercuum f. sp. fusiforme G11]